MEHNLRCNNLDCRKELNDRALVTTCSHIFCLECSSRLELSNPPPGRRPVCPACETALNNVDDAVDTNLRPTEDYKTSVLSGLSPSVIMECTGRALSFWAYQVTQEIAYDEIMIKSLTQRYEALFSHTERVTKEANEEITKLSNKLTSTRGDVEMLNAKNKELHTSYTEEHNKYLKMKERFDRMNHKSMLGHVQEAAYDNVERTVQASAMASRFENRGIVTDQHSYPQDFSRNAPRRGSLDHLMYAPSVPRPAATPMRQNNATVPHLNNQPIGPRGFQNMHSYQAAPQHRQVVVGTPAVRRAQSQSFTTPLPQSRPLQHSDISRKPVIRPSPNGAPNHAGFSGYGMSGGMKTSRPQPTQSAMGFSDARDRPQYTSRINDRRGLISSNLQHSFSAMEEPLHRSNEHYVN